MRGDKLKWSFCSFTAVNINRAEIDRARARVCLCLSVSAHLAVRRYPLCVSASRTKQTKTVDVARLFDDATTVHRERSIGGKESE